MGLASDDIRAVIARAVEIQATARLDTADVEAVIQAAEEVGIPRFAIERALRERLPLPVSPPSVGDLTFARSMDGRYYVAEVLSTAEQSARVQFLRGSTLDAPLEELRPCALLPGERVVCQWPWWGPWTCTVMSYDAAGRRVTVTDGWGEVRTFGLDEVWLAPVDAKTRSRRRIYAALIGGAATAGAAIGALITALLIG